MALTDRQRQLLISEALRHQVLAQLMEEPALCRDHETVAGAIYAALAGEGVARCV